MRITLAKNVQKRLPKKLYVRVRTTFVTEDGPAEGTIWFDAELPKQEPLIVDHVDQGGNHVRYDNGFSETLHVFLERVAEGRYILIGVVPDTIGHTVL